MQQNTPEKQLQKLPVYSTLSTPLPFQEAGIDRIKNLEGWYRGGFILSATGTGKTFQILSHIVNSINKHPNQTNLIVCPSHLINNWYEEITKHFCDTKESDTKESDTNILTSNINIFHGSSKSYKRVHFTITSYNLLKCKELQDVRFTRIILDEAHYIRNKTTKFYNNACNLSSQFRWCLTATPVMNSDKDLQSYVTFLELQVPKSITPKMLHKFSLLQSVDNIKLPTCTETVLNLEMCPEQSQIFYKLLDVAKHRIKDIKTFMGEESNQIIRRIYRASFLTVILRLRQACNFVSKPKYSEIDTETNEECSICMNNKSQMATSTCNHKLCLSCWQKILVIKPSCPFCRGHTQIKDLTYEKESEDPNNKKNLEYISVKMVKLLELIGERDHKVIVSSQWVTTLDYIQDTLSTSNIAFRKVYRIDGSLNITGKSNILNSFKKDTSNAILLISLTSAAEGLNITEAKTMIHYDFWWNSQKTAQMSARIHRLGQIDTTEIFYLKTKNTIEMFMETINNTKREMECHYIKTKCKENKCFSTAGIIAQIMSFDSTKRLNELEYNNTIVLPEYIL